MASSGKTLKNKKKTEDTSEVRKVTHLVVSFKISDHSKLSPGSRQAPLEGSGVFSANLKKVRLQKSWLYLLIFLITSGLLERAEVFQTYIYITQENHTKTNKNHIKTTQKPPNTTKNHTKTTKTKTKKQNRIQNTTTRAPLAFKRDPKRERHCSSRSEWGSDHHGHLQRMLGCRGGDRGRQNGSTPKENHFCWKCKNMQKPSNTSFLRKGRKRKPIMINQVWQKKDLKHDKTFWNLLKKTATAI